MAGVVLILSSAIFTFVSNFSLYILILAHWRMDGTFHWILCHFTIAELMRSIAAVANGIVGINFRAKARLFTSRIEGFNLTSNRELRWLVIEHKGQKATLELASNTALFCSLLFALFSLLQLYKKLKAPSRPGQKFGLVHAVGVSAVWVITIAYFVSQMILIQNSLLQDSELGRRSPALVYLNWLIVVFIVFWLTGAVVLIYKFVKLYLRGHREMVLYEEAREALCDTLDSIIAKRKKWKIKLVMSICVIIIFAIFNILYGIQDLLLLIASHQLLSVQHIHTGFKIATDVLMFLFTGTLPLFWIYTDSDLHKTCRAAVEIFERRSRRWYRTHISRDRRSPPSAEV